MRIERGTVVLVELNPTGVRPCVIVSDPEVTADQRFPLLCVVPITGTAGEGALYPALAPGRSGLTKPSFVLVDQLRPIDKRRLRHVFRRITPAELEAIDTGLCLYLGLDPNGVDFPGHEDH